MKRGLFEVLHTLAIKYLVRKKLPNGHVGVNSYIHTPSIISKGVENIYLGNNVNIDWNNTIYANNAKFIVGDNTAIAIGLTVITGNHKTMPGETLRDRGNDNLEGKDVIIETEVWVGANVTLLAGTIVGRGAIIGAGSVLRGQKIPPYAIVTGNPAKIVGFRFTPEEIVEHERVLYEEKDQLPFDVLEKNYEKYFLKRIKEIKEYTKL